MSHTTSYADSDIYYYKVIPFGLINAEVTYQRIVNKLFANMIETKMETYVDDMLVKSNKGVNHQEDLKKGFARMTLYSVRFTPSKCAFDIN